MLERKIAALAQFVLAVRVESAAKRPLTMKFISMLVAVAAAASAHASVLQANPIQKTVQLLDDLAAKITQEMEEAAQDNAEFTKWCVAEKRNFKYGIETATEALEDLSAKIEKSSADASALEAKISSLASDISKADADLKAATGVRNEEADDFSKTHVELKDTISAIERAIGILKTHASLLQGAGGQNLADALTAMVQASAITAADASKLTSLVQTTNNADSDDGDLGAPAAAVYDGHSKSIVEVLEDLLDKAESQLNDEQKKEMEAKHSFELVKQSLEDEMKYNTKEMSDSKASLAASAEAKAAATADKSMTEKDLAADKEGLANLESDCATKDADYKAASESRDEELKAIAAAKDALESKTGGAESIAYSLAQTAKAAPAFVQLEQRSETDAALPNPSFEAVHFVRRLAREQKSEALALLASRMDSMVSVSATSGEDPFAKVRGLIADMIARLEKEAGADASHKAYCDKELSESTSKKEEKKAEVDKLQTKIDSMSAQAAKLKEEVAELQKELAELAASSAALSEMRSTEHAQYIKDKPEMEEGIEGVKTAIKVLREYYSQESPTAATGTGESIIGLLEVVESDFTKSLAEIEAVEQAAAAAYDKTSKEMAILKTTKDQDVKYKSKEASGLDKSIAETTSDLEGVQAELDAVLEYLGKLEEQCVAKPQTYAERKARRAAEISGLKEALSILESETALVQKGAARRALRSVHVHTGSHA